MIMLIRHHIHLADNAIYDFICKWLFRNKGMIKIVTEIGKKSR